MSTFSTKGGLYERAQQRYGVADGKKLFTYTFFEKQRLPALVRHGNLIVTLLLPEVLLAHRQQVLEVVTHCPGAFHSTWIVT